MGLSGEAWKPRGRGGKHHRPNQKRGSNEERSLAQAFSPSQPICGGRWSRWISPGQAPSQDEKVTFYKSHQRSVILIWLPRSPVLDEVLSGWRAEATNATDPEYEVRITHFFSDRVLIFAQVLRVEGVETEGSIVVDPEISFNK